MLSSYLPLGNLYFMLTICTSLGSIAH
jgi:hypothetical protein